MKRVYETVNGESGGKIYTPDGKRSAIVPCFIGISLGVLRELVA